MPEITIFTAPKPFTNPHIAILQRNAIQSWLALGPAVDVILVGEEEGLAEAAAELGVRHLPNVARNALGTPLIPSIFDLARQASNAPLLAYVNADIILLPDFVETCRQAAQFKREFLVVGQRWDLEVTELLDFSGDWAARLQARCRESGKLHARMGSDYFVFPRALFADMPAFAIGRAGWDNWMIYHARRSGWLVIDGTESAQIIHQNHDYSHLPGGQPHYKLPETFENIRLAGGRLVTRFTLLDTNRRLKDGRLLPPFGGREKFWREVEIFPLVGLRSMALGKLAYALFHPQRAYREWRSG